MIVGVHPATEGTEDWDFTLRIARLDYEGTLRELARFEEIGRQLQLPEMTRSAALTRSRVLDFYERDCLLGQVSHGTR